MNSNNKPAAPSLSGVRFEERWVSPEDAEDMLTHNERNRALRPTHVRTLTSDMVSGNYLFTGDTVKFDRTGRLIDGQHRLNGIVKSGVGQWVLVVRGLDPRVQAVIDAHARRSAGNALRFVFEDASAVETAASIARMCLMIDGMRAPTAVSSTYANRKHSNADVVAWAEDNPDVFEISAKAKQLSSRTHSGAGIPAALGGWILLHAHRIDPAMTHQFFLPLHDRAEPFGVMGDGSVVDPREDPRYAFHTAVKAMGMEDKRTLRIPVFGALAWNEWRSGRPRRIYKAVPNGKPVPLPKMV